MSDSSYLGKFYGLDAAQMRAQAVNELMTNNAKELSKCRKLSLETNLRRQKMKEKIEKEKIQEEIRRQEILTKRKEQHRQANERFHQMRRVSSASRLSLTSGATTPNSTARLESFRFTDNHSTSSSPAMSNVLDMVMKSGRVYETKSPESNENITRQFSTGFTSLLKRSSSFDGFYHVSGQNDDRNDNSRHKSNIMDPGEGNWGDKDNKQPRRFETDSSLGKKLELHQRDVWKQQQQLTEKFSEILLQEIKSGKESQRISTYQSRLQDSLEDASSIISHEKPSFKGDTLSGHEHLHQLTHSLKCVDQLDTRIPSAAISTSTKGILKKEGSVDLNNSLPLSDINRHALEASKVINSIELSRHSLLHRSHSTDSLDSLRKKKSVRFAEQFSSDRDVIQPSQLQEMSSNLHQSTLSSGDTFNSESKTTLRGRSRSNADLTSKGHDKTHQSTLSCNNIPSKLDSTRSNYSNDSSVLSSSKRDSLRQNKPPIYPRRDVASGKPDLGKYSYASRPSPHRSLRRVKKPSVEKITQDALDQRLVAAGIVSPFTMNHHLNSSPQTLCENDIHSLPSHNDDTDSTQFTETSSVTNYEFDDLQSRRTDTSSPVSVDRIVSRQLPKKYQHKTVDKDLMLMKTPTDADIEELWAEVRSYNRQSISGKQSSRQYGELNQTGSISSHDGINNRPVLYNTVDTPSLPPSESSIRSAPIVKLGERERQRRLGNSKIVPLRSTQSDVKGRVRQSSDSLGEFLEAETFCRTQPMETFERVHSHKQITEEKFKHQAQVAATSSDVNYRSSNIRGSSRPPLNSTVPSSLIIRPINPSFLSSNPHTMNSTLHSPSATPSSRRGIGGQPMSHMSIEEQRLLASLDRLDRKLKDVLKTTRNGR